MAAAKLSPEIHKEIALRYKTGEKSVALAREFGVSISAILYILRKAEIPRRGVRGRRYRINHHAFNELTPEAAYWIGFLMADGCIRRDSGKYWRIYLTQNRRRASHLERFMDFIGTDKPLCYKKDGCVVASIFSDEIASKLNSYGVIPRKSRKAKASIELVSNRDFWRGYVDGDGCIRRRSDGYAHCFVMGAYPLMQQYLSYVKLVVPESRVNLYPQYQQSNIYRVVLSGSTAVKVLRQLYQNAQIALDDKMVIVKDLISVA